MQRGGSVQNAHACPVKTLTTSADAVATRREDHRSPTSGPEVPHRQWALDRSKRQIDLKDAFAVDQMKREVSVADNVRNWQAELSDR